MNNFTISPDGPLAPNTVSSYSFHFVFGVSIGILSLLTTLTLASYFCSKGNAPPPPPRSLIPSNLHHLPNEPPDFAIHVGMGLEEHTIKSYPEMLYSEVEFQRRLDSAAVSCCSICLADYKNTDVLRRLPDCGHVFHLHCIDPWLRLNPSCPVCRTSPVPTPLSTPLAEVIPLANRQR